MKAYRTYLTVTDSQQVILNDVPFQPGECVEVLVLTKSDANASDIAELQALFADTQALPQNAAMNEDEIAAEVAAHQSGR